MECHHNGQGAEAHDVRGDAETAGFVMCEEEEAKARERMGGTVNLLSLLYG